MTRQKTTAWHEMTACALGEAIAAGDIDPDQCLRYSREEARRWVLRAKHFGPWEGPEGCPQLEDFAEDEDEENAE